MTLLILISSYFTQRGLQSSIIDGNRGQEVDKISSSSSSSSVDDFSSILFKDYVFWVSDSDSSSM